MKKEEFRWRLDQPRVLTSGSRNSNNPPYETNQYLNRQRNFPRRMEEGGSDPLLKKGDSTNKTNTLNLISE